MLVVLRLLHIDTTHATDVFITTFVGFLSFKDRVWIDKRRAIRTLDNIAEQGNFSKAIGYLAHILYIYTIFLLGESFLICQFWQLN